MKGPRVKYVPAAVGAICTPVGAALLAGRVSVGILVAGLLALALDRRS